MCGTCGCSDGNNTIITDLQKGNTTRIGAHHSHDQDGDTHDHGPHGHDHHHHGHDHAHGDAAHTHAHVHGTTISLEQDILAKNNLLAQRNRGWFEGREILALNLVSSPGAGKTAILERTIRDLGGTLPIHVLEGDQDTVRDAERIMAAGARVVQINTGTGCHLDAHMVTHALEELNPPLGALVMIENVGNLVCPSLFDLGEFCKVAILSVPEGDDKPVKYPHMFRASDLMLLNKIDLLPHVAFDVDKCLDYARQVNPELKVIQVSATTGEGMDEWYAWLKEAFAR